MFFATFVRLESQGLAAYKIGEYVTAKAHLVDAGEHTVVRVYVVWARASCLSVFEAPWLDACTIDNRRGL